MTVVAKGGRHIDLKVSAFEKRERHGSWEVMKSEHLLQTKDQHALGFGTNSVPLDMSSKIFEHLLTHL